MAGSTIASPHRLSPWLILFALPFFGVGVFMAGWTWRDVLRSRTILAEWREVPAYIEQTDVKVSRGRKGGSTYRVTGTYRYNYDGQTFRSDEITLGGGSDNIGRFHHRLHSQMRRAKNAGQPMTAYVNPAAPAEAVLWPWWRIEMGLFRAIFGTMFGGVGAGMLAGCLASWWRGRAQGTARAAHPTEPWRWRADWAAAEVRPSYLNKTIIAWTVLVVLHAATLPLWSGWSAGWAQGGGVRWGLCVAAGVVAIGSAFALRTLLRVRQHRDVRVVLTDLPLRPGAPAGLGLVLPGGLAAGFTLKTELKCLRRRTVRSGKKTRVEETVLWRVEQAHPGPFNPGQVVAWAPELPAGQPGADPEPSDDCVLWRLEATGRGPGPDLVAAFELPVFGPSAPAPAPAAQGNRP